MTNNMERAKKFSEMITEESYDEAELPTNRRMGPVNLTRKSTAPTPASEARIQSLVSKIKDMCRARLTGASEADDLNQRVSSLIGRGVPELLERGRLEKEQNKGEILAAIYEVLEWCVSELKITDVVMENKLRTSYEEGHQNGLDEASKMYREELERAKGGLDPLTRSLNEKLK